MITLTVILLISVLGILWPWTIYPLVCRMFPVVQTRQQTWSGMLPRVSVLVPAYNEREHIAEKLESILSWDYPQSLLEVIVATDGSTDGTDEIVEIFADRGVRLIRARRNRGKAHALNQLFDEASGDLWLLSDASARLSKDALLEMVARMEDANIGCVVARYVPNQQDRRQASAYWSRETALKQLKSQRGLLMGAHGSGYMVRASLVEPLPNHLIHDDFIIPARIRAAGFGVAYCEAAVAVEASFDTSEQVLARAARIAWGNWQMFDRYRRWLRPTTGPFWWTFAGHKFAKTLVPFWIVSGAVSSLALIFLGASAIGSPAFASSAIVGALALGMFAVTYVRPLETAARTIAGSLAGSVRYWAGLPTPWGARSASLPQPPLGVRILKRAIDVLAGLFGLVLAAPVMLVVAVAIRLDSPGPVLFSQERVRTRIDGHEVTFRLYKFRSMVENAEQASGPVWATEHDPRITRVGRVLRQTRLDELPQLFNVLAGDMSLVGPRPERPHFTRELRAMIPGYDDRIQAIKPGITGWAQIHCEYDTSLDSVRRKLLYDLTYVAHLYSPVTYLLMELRILAKTVLVALTGKGAH
jgi:lipopolysaccharide/colanic/teichoic acid biosynthesis glycosyltransferase/glycosyltransferase involved in cell wall biosynthesis